MLSRLSAIGLALIASAAVLAGQAPDQQNQESFKFRTGVELINVNATVTDQSGRFVGGLTKDDFRVFDDEQPQTVTHFSAERVPVSLGIVLDTSGSMDGEKMYAAKQALERFLFQLLDPEDEVFLYRFDNNPELVEGWTRDKQRVSDALRRIQPRGGTALYDAVADAVRLAQQGHNKKKAVVIISDGNDTSSRTDVYSLKQLIRETEVLVYAIGIDAPDARPSTRVNPEALREITGPSGGYTEVVRSAADLGPATARIADELNKQYTFAYVSSRPPDNTWRNIRVHVTKGDYLARARRMYFAEKVTS